MILGELALPALVVWIPMLDRDEGSEVPHASRSITVTPQFFDGEKRLGDQLARALGVEWTVWDAFLFYAPGAVSGPEGLPAPEVVVAQVAGVVAATPGTLPPSADQSALDVHAPQLRGKLVVVGAQQDIEAILRQVGQTFVARHRR